MIDEDLSTNQEPAMKVTLIRDIESRGIISLPPEATLDEALAVMDEKKISFLVILRDSKAVGVLTERDVVRLAAEHAMAGQMLLCKVMSSPVHTMCEDADIFEAYDALVAHQIRHLVVTDTHGKVAGLITQSNLLGNLGIEYFIELKHVSSIMTHILLTLTAEAPVQQALDIMAKERISCVIVVEDDKPVGILTERDVTRLCHAHMNVQTTVMRQVMTSPVKTMPEIAYVPEVNQFMQEKGLRHVVIVDNDGKLAGLISQSNLTRGLEEKYVSFLKRMLRTRNHAIQRGKAQHEALFELNPNASFRLDARGVVHDCNIASTFLTGYTAEDTLGRNLAQFMDSGDVRLFEQALCKAGKNNPSHCECYIHNVSGEPVALFLSLIPVRKTGEARQIYAIAHDITEKKKTEDELRFRAALERILTSISTEFINIPSTEVDTGIDRALKRIGEFLDVDRSYVFRFRKQQTRMDNTHEWCPDGIRAHIDRRQDLKTEVLPRFIKKIKHKEVFKVSCVAALPPESAREVLFDPESVQARICVPMISAGETVAFLGFDSVHRQRIWSGDIVTLLKMVGIIFSLAMERKETEEKLKHMAHSDSLTGLPNRALFFDRLAQALVRARRRKQHLAVLFVDLDRFKSINDTFGHATGDAALKQVAQRLHHCTREEDTIARMGGDEFTIILAELGKPDHAAFVSQKILVSLAEPFILKGKDCSLGCSIGIAIYPADGEDSETLLKRADTAMYRAKQKGNEYSFYAQKTE